MNTSRKYLVGTMITTLALAASACSGSQQVSPSEQSSATTHTTTVAATETQTTQPATPTHAPAQPSAPSCDSEVGQWNTLNDSTPVSVGVSEVLDVRAGKHACFDRIVIETGSLHRVGFQVGYVDQVAREGSGLPVPVSGNATLQVDINTAGYNFTQCSYTYNWQSLQQLACAGFFEGNTKFAIGVSERKPFAVHHLANNDKGTMRAVIDIAH